MEMRVTVISFRILLDILLGRNDTYWVSNRAISWVSNRAMPRVVKLFNAAKYWHWLKKSKIELTSTLKLIKMIIKSKLAGSIISLFRVCAPV